MENHSVNTPRGEGGRANDLSARGYLEVVNARDLKLARRRPPAIGGGAGPRRATAAEGVPALPQLPDLRGVRRVS